MLTSQRRIRLILFLSALVMLMFLATAMPAMTFEAGGPFPFGIFTGDISPEAPQQSVGSTGDGSIFRLVSIIVIWIGLPLAVIYLFVSPEGRQRLLRMLPMIFILMALLFWLDQVEQEPREVEGEGALGGEFGLPTEPLPPVPEFVADPPQWLLTGVNVLLVLLFLGLTYLLWRLFNRQREPEPEALIIKEAERALADLHAGEDLKNTIIRCYAEMSNVLQRDKHIKRRRGMTVREFEDQLMAMGLDDDHISRLTRLFEQVRYSTQSLGGREEREAVDCLNAIIRTYGEAR